MQYLANILILLLLKIFFPKITLPTRLSSRKYDYNSINIYQNSQVWEGQFIEIIGKQLDKKVILGNIYRPPEHNNETCKTFINEFIPLLGHLQKCKSEVIIAGDYNIDLLQIKENAIFGEYFDSVVAQDFFP